MAKRICEAAAMEAGVFGNFELNAPTCDNPATVEVQGYWLCEECEGGLDQLRVVRSLFSDSQVREVVDQVVAEEWQSARRRVGLLALLSGGFVGALAVIGWGPEGVGARLSQILLVASGAGLLRWVLR